MKQASKNTIFPYFIVIVLDAVGFGIVAPILAPLVSHSHSVFFGGVGDVGRHVIFGFILAIFPFSFMLGAPILGALSDQLGRKRVLLICLLGTLLGFIIYAFSFIFSSVLLLIVARFVAGFTSASQGVGQAAMVDVSKGKQKAVNIALIAVALSIGLVLGPLLGGVLSDDKLVPWFGLATPFYFIIIVSVFNLILLQYKVYDQPGQKTALSFSQHYQALINLFRVRSIAAILFVFFCFELSWSLYYQSLALLLVNRFHYHAASIGLFSSYVGLSLSFGLLVLVRFFVRLYSLNSIIKFSLLLGVISILTLYFSRSMFAQYLLAVPITCSVALVYSSIIAKASDLVDRRHQGLLMGVTDALLALAFAVTGFLSGWLAYFSVKLPELLAVGFMLVACLAAARLKQFKSTVA